LGMGAPGRTVVTIGVFDGVHRGHRHLVSTARERADSLGLPLIAVTFDPHPAAVVGRGEPPVRLAALEQRVELLKEAGADSVEVLHFDSDLAQMPAGEFVKRVIVGRFGARSVVVGPDFRFGHRAAGDVATLAAAGARLDYDVVVATPAGDGGLRWSSTLCRERILAGDVRGAAEVLGRPFRLVGEVVRGDGRGRGLGFPTANLALADGLAVPADGVYAGSLRVMAEGDDPPWVDGDGFRLAAISIGTNPQFDGRVRQVEAHVVDVGDIDLYGRRVAVDFLERLRGQRVFADVAALVSQMALDVDRVRALVPGPVAHGDGPGSDRLLPS